MPSLPLTPSDLAADIRTLGVQPGDALILHSSLRAIAGPDGWIVGGAEAVILAFEDVLTPAGTLVMPTHSGHLSEPSYWVAPPVPEAWWPIVRAHMPAYRPDLTVTRGMGLIPETFRKQDGVRRSDHPQHSFAAWGRHAALVTHGHALNASFGEASPLARLYELDGWVVLAGVGHDRNTSLHLAEARATWPGQQRETQGAPVWRDGVRAWVTFDTGTFDSDDFPLIGQAYAAAGGDLTTGRIGQAATLRLPMRPLVAFAADWIAAQRR